MVKKIIVNLAILIIIGIAIRSYFSASKVNAEKKAKAFCATLKLGDSAKGIREKALASGASQFSGMIEGGGFYDPETGKYDNSFEAIFIPPRVQERHICHVTIRRDDSETIKAFGYSFVPTL